jgi:hypothetical protein
LEIALSFHCLKNQSQGGKIIETSHWKETKMLEVSKTIAQFNEHFFMGHENPFYVFGSSLTFTTKHYTTGRQTALCLA